MLKCHLLQEASLTTPAEESFSPPGLHLQDLNPVFVSFLICVNEWRQVPACDAHKQDTRGWASGCAAMGHRGRWAGHLRSGASWGLLSVAGPPAPAPGLCSSVKCMGKLGTSLLPPRTRVVVTSLSACKDEASAKPHLSANH